MNTTSQGGISISELVSRPEPGPRPARDSQPESAPAPSWRSAHAPLPVPEQPKADGSIPEDAATDAQTTDAQTTDAQTTDAAATGTPATGATASHSTTPGSTTPGTAPPAAATPATPAPRDPSLPPAIAPDEFDRLRSGRHHDPHSLLGAHRANGRVFVRAFKPWASAVDAVTAGGVHPLVDEGDGLFSAFIPDEGTPGEGIPAYRLRARYADAECTHADVYSFLPTVNGFDLHLISEGRHEELWRVLGSHVRTIGTGPDAVTGVSFAVWAPNAQGVRVVGDFNCWDGQAHPMRSLGSSGVWELFIPEAGDGTTYKYEVTGRDGVARHKADPMAFATEVPPATGSVVHTPAHAWSDREWMERRAQLRQYAEPLSIYEVHLGSWRAGLGYVELADQLAEYVGGLGFTHVEFLPVAEHPFGGSWGYQVSSYYAPTSRFGSPDEFRHLVERLHQAGIGVIVDWVPAHFPRDEWALARFDGAPLYEHEDPRRGEHPDWGTLVFDYGRREVRNFLVANASFWCEEFHIDGLRVDAVASMLYLDYSRGHGQWSPNVFGGRENLDAVAFLQETNATVYRRSPGVMMIAEESTAWDGVTRPTTSGGLGFGFKWNMGWMHDSLDYISRDPIYRQYHHHQMTFAMVYAYSENYILPISHDEVVHGKGSLVAKMPGDESQRLAGVRSFLAFMWAHPGKKLLFMGSEFAQPEEWSESGSLRWDLLEDATHAGIHELVGDLNARYREHRALWEQDTVPAGFAWTEANDGAGNTYAFLRFGKADPSGGTPTPGLSCVANFSPMPREAYRVGLPWAGTWREVLNTDSELYGGTNIGNLGQVHAEQVPWNGQPCSAVLRVPPLGVVWLASEG